MSTPTPLLFDASGPIATPPATLQQNLIAAVAAQVPGYTANLPGSLIEDISSTDVGALITIDQARVDVVNSISPYGANPYVLAQLGAQFGIPQGLPANGSAYVVFTGTAGYVIPSGFLVSDGTNQYVVQDGGVVQTSGVSLPLFCVATNAGTFAIPLNSVNQVVTSIPTGYSITCANPQAGTPAVAPETVESYRARLLGAFQVGTVASVTYLKALLSMIPGVAARLISVIQNGSSWEVICGGGDSYAVAQAIYQGCSSPGLLVGSATSARNITVSIYDAPNTYSVVYVNPPSQTVTVAVTWNTTLANFTAGGTVNQLIIPVVQSYINSIPVGQPINLMVMTEQIQQAIANVLAPQNLTTLTFAVTINGTTATPTAGTSIIPSDPESYFSIVASAITSIQ